ncbi:hypothetical protein AAW51_2195 [Caldimonas brevitalea]|uniref:FHA domain-containing protein n=2 Tax=Caldimonas brevitalea TaxID=413882 RepID=A0A0G3BNF7_9BURK|nr:hypothetical protein AAW51_2195 [Caldimonas brevitalea]
MGAQFGPAGGTIGRNEGNTLVLPDDAKTISRQQALIQMQGGQYVLIDKGANPTLRNRAPVGAGQSVPLVPGDELRIGPYVLLVEGPATRPVDPHSTQVNPGGLAAVASTPGRPATAPGAAFDPFALPPAGAPGGAHTDPFADLFSTPPAAPGSSPPARPAPEAFGLGPAPAPPAVRPPSPSAGAAAIPDDFDPFASFSGRSAGAAPAPAPGFASTGIPTTGSFNPLSSGARRMPPPIPFNPQAGHEDLLGPAVEKSASIDELFGLGGAPANPLDVLGPGIGSAPGNSQPVDDPLALFGGTPAGARGAGAAQPDDTPAINSAFALPDPIAPGAPGGRATVPPPPPASRPAAAPLPPPPGGVSAKAIDDLLASVGPLDPKGATGQFRVAQPAHPTAPLPPAAAPAPAAPSAAVPPAPGAAAGAAAPGAATPAGSQVSVDALMSAFCEGLGSPVNLPDGVTEEFMFRMGGLVREAVQGTVDLLRARAVTKREVKASATMIMERNNNPLKFSPDAKTAMLYLVSGRLNPAFMPPITAMRDAYYDLRSHQFGFMAGTKAALEGVLERFEPQRLEGRLSTRGLVESLIPAARKARLWDLFTELYKEIAREAEDDFHALFGQAFLKAYEEHVEALRRDVPQE